MIANLKVYSQDWCEEFLLTFHPKVIHPVNNNMFVKPELLA